MSDIWMWIALAEAVALFALLVVLYKALILISATGRQLDSMHLTLTEIRRQERDS